MVPGFVEACSQVSGNVSFFESWIENEGSERNGAGRPATEILWFFRSN
ncbi:hypothetical protein [Rubritalea tangerina]